MPVYKGFSYHSMMGRHIEAMRESAIILNVDAARDGDNINATVTLHNILPHNAPTGAPFLNMHVQVTGIGSDGKLVWSNYQEHPIKEDPKSMLRLVLLDKDGKPSPPPKATHVGKD